MRRGLLLAGEQPRAFERDVDAEIFPRKLRRIADREHLDRADATLDGVALDRHLARESAVDRIEAQQMRIGLGWGQVVDGNDGDILAVALDDCTQHHAADTTKSIDGNSY